MLLGLSALPAGDYYQQEAVRFYLPAGSESKDKGRGKNKNKYSSFSGSSDTDEEWAELPRHSLA